VDSRDMPVGRTTSAWAGWVAFAGVNAIVQLGFLAAYPVWSILIIALDVVVIYALIVHGRELADR
jgi:hypothetical protein